MKLKLLLCTCLPYLLSGVHESFGQSAPGGVTPAAWYKADASGTIYSDAGITPAADNAAVQQWNSTAGTGNLPLLQNTVASRPVFSSITTMANFNPTVTFDGSNDWMQFTAPSGVDIIDRANGTLYAAGFVNTLKRNGFLGFHPSMDYPGLHIFSGNYHLLFFTGGPGYQGQSAGPMTSESFFTAGTGWQNGAGTTSAYAAATVTLNGNRLDYTGSQLYNANLSTGARDLRVGADNNYGAFSGQLNEVIVFEERLSQAQMDQVETYLAIKYGTTYADGTKSYVNSSGATVWSDVGNAGYHYNIAGIARDDNGALYQKQSWSTNPGRQVLIGVGGLANTNADNTGSLTDGQYLVWGDNGQPKMPTVATTAFPALSHRFASVWKVQHNGVGTVRVAWPKGWSNLTLIQSQDNTFDGSDVATDMTANEITINGTVYNFADVSLTNGHYFTFGAKLVAPGGVSNALRVWLKADSGFTVSSWTDFSGNDNHFTQTNTNRQPFVAAQQYNFNPIIDFGSGASADGRFMVVPDGKPFSANGLSGTFFTTTLTRSGGTSGYRDILGFGNTTAGAGLINADIPTITKLNNNIVLYNSTTSAFPNQYPDNVLLLSDVSYTVGVPGIRYGLNGDTASTNQTRSAAASQQANGSVLGSQPQVTNGLIGEVIAYERDLTEAEKIRVRSYVAIKYGLTLEHDYVASNGTTVFWDQSAHAGYQNNIAGIARDDDGALNQKQSASINSPAEVLIGTTGLGASNAANTIMLDDQQFLVWGDNGSAKVPSVGISGVSGVNYRFASVWNVQNTNAVGSVRVAWPAGLTNLTLVLSTDPAFATISTAQSMVSNTTVINGTVYNYADVILADGIYFTFAAQLNGPGGVGNDLRVWLRPDAGFTPGAWTDFSGNDNHFTQTNANRQPFVAAQQYNFNPIIDFGSGASADGRFMVVPDGKPFSANGLSGTFFTTTLTRSGGTSGYRDILGFGATTTGAGLINADIPTVTKLNNDIVLYNSTTSAFPNQYPDNVLLLSDVSYTVGVPGIRYGLNGDTASTNQTRSAAASQQANGSVLGSQPQVTNGLIGEVIAYERDLTEAEKIRVRSYVAIRYGLTLGHDYVASNGTTVFWDQSAHAGYQNNIAGIARDDYGSLNQKQSASINSPAEVLIGTTGLGVSNAANTIMLDDQQFLAWGDNGLAKGPTVSITGISGVNNRFAAAWNVQNTNTVGTVRVAWPAGLANLKLIVSTDNTIDATDNIYDMSSTQLINGVEYAYADVSLEDNVYFTFAAFVRGPGGVTHGLSHWYRADIFAQSAGDSTAVTSWTDFTSGVVSAQINDAPLPEFKEGEATYFNFNPGIHFTAIQEMLGNISVQALSNQNFDIFSLTKEGMSGTRFFNIGQNNTTFSGANWDQPGLYANGGIARRNNTGGLQYNGVPGGGNANYATNSPSIMYHNFGNTFFKRGLNGGPSGTAITHGAIGDVTGGLIFGANGGVNPPGGDDWGFTGHIGELILYGNDTLTAAERNKVETYLAIKYGVTLHNSNNYTTSQDTVIWDASANAAYYNNVAGIGNDFMSALEQKQSRSQQANGNSQVSIGLGNIAVTNAANPNEINDGRFLVWGDNGNTQAMTNTAGSFTTFSYAGGTDNGRRMNRVWKVQNTDMTDEVLIRFPKTAVGTTTLPAGELCAKYALLTAGDTAFTTNVSAIALVENDTNFEVNYAFPPGMHYFTFGKVTPLDNGIVYLPAVIEETGEYDDNCGVGAWVHFHKTGSVSEKLLGMSGYPGTDLDSFKITITPEGIGYNDNTRITNVMARITNVADSNAAPVSPGKVKIYYSTTEMTNSMVSGASTSGWFKYNGDANAAMTDIYDDGVFDAGMAVALTPNTTGVENGVHYVEFHDVDTFGSFIFLSSTEDLGVILPVRLYGFNARKTGETVMLNWFTAFEHNNKGFVVQRSADGVSWEDIGFVASLGKAGNSNHTLGYSFADTDPLKARNFYRLKQVDFDGNYEYSVIRQVDFAVGPRSDIRVVPNPVKGILKITGLTGRSFIAISNAWGQILWKASVQNQSEHTVNMAAYRPGVYIISIQEESGAVRTHKIVKE